MFEGDSNPIYKKEEKYNSEHKWKELLYKLFYEIKSETLGAKIEIDEEEYQENINKITIPKLITYIHESIQILVMKKIESAKSDQKEEDKKYIQEMSDPDLSKYKINDKERNIYENIIKKLEEKERKLLRINFHHCLQKEAMENRISELIDIEDEYEEMKIKFKYEDGRFLNNDRKDNEILIIRSENSNLKHIVDELEVKIKNLENANEQLNKKVKILSQEVENLKSKLDEKKQTELNLSQNFFYNITNHNHNLTKNSNNNKTKCLLNSDENNNNNQDIIKHKVTNYYKISNHRDKNKIEHNNTVKDYRNHNMKLINSQCHKLQSKVLSKGPEDERTSIDKKFIKNMSNNKNELSNTARNEYTERLNHKYYTGNFNNNKDSKKKNKVFSMSNSRIMNGKYSNFFSKNTNINNLYRAKKIIANSSLRNSRPNSTKITTKKNSNIYCRLSSGD